MSDWQVGDLAVCVDDSPCRCSRCELGLESRVLSISAGGIYRVEAVSISSKDGRTILVLEGVPARLGHLRGTSANRFRKIRPDERKACEPEFVTLLKRSRKTVRA